MDLTFLYILSRNERLRHYCRCTPHIRSGMWFLCSPLWLHVAFMPKVLSMIIWQQNDPDFIFFLRLVGRSIQLKLGSVSLCVFVMISLGTGAFYFYVACSKVSFSKLRSLCLATC